MEEPQFVEKADPEEVFATLSDDTRIAVLRALWDADGEEVTFSDLREAVGMRDSGQFNYHLDKLVGQFVTKTEDGYELTRAGLRINGAIDAGAYTMEGTLDPIELDEPCPTCGGDRTLYYEDETVEIDCESCSAGAAFGVPPSAFAGCDRERISAVAGRYLHTTFQHIADGFCPFCEGRVHPTVGPVAEMVDLPDEPPEDASEEVFERIQDVPFVRYDCDRCGANPGAGLALALRSHPAVVSFYHDHGIDVRDRSIWNFAGFDPERETVTQRDPLRARMTYHADGDNITLTVDGALDVIEID